MRVVGEIGRLFRPGFTLLSSIRPKFHKVASRAYSAELNVDDYENKWTTFFRNDAFDQFELQRGLNNCFIHDIVPTIPVLEAALRACRRLNDLETAMRVFGALREKCKDEKEYKDYVKYLDPIKQELGISAPEDFGRL